MSSDFVKIYFQLEQNEEGYPPVAVESVWAKPAGSPHEYKLDNIPFFAREATFDDTIMVRVQDGHFWFERIVHRSGNSLIRIILVDHSEISSLIAQLESIGCSVEYLKSYHLLAVNIPSTVRLSDVQAYLQRESERGKIDYEEPILRQ